MSVPNPRDGGQPPARPEACVVFRWPGAGIADECDNFFLGAWYPQGSLRVEWAGAPAGCVRRQGPNWFLASAASPLHAPDTGLIHGDVGRSSGVAFRGYILPHLHSYSATEEVLGYWERQPHPEHNGVFSAALIGPGGNTLTLITDVLGMGPLYYRMLGGLVLFSTNPRYLATSDDRPDLVAWRSLVQCSWIVGDRSLSRDVQRVPAGHAIRFSADGQRSLPWFDFDRLPSGTRSVGPGAVGEVEEAFQQAISRCLGLGGGGSVLSLSSGFDSRRILASLVHRAVNFQAITRRVFQRDYRDLDGRFASEMARAFGFHHSVVEPGGVDQYVADDRVRRLLVDSETREHSWVPRLMQALPNQPSLFFDGIAGDILGNPVGWQVLTGLAIESRSPEHELEAIVAHAISPGFDAI